MKSSISISLILRIVKSHKNLKITYRTHHLERIHTGIAFGVYLHYSRSSFCYQVDSGLHVCGTYHKHQIIVHLESFEQIRMIEGLCYQAGLFVEAPKMNMLRNSVFGQVEVARVIYNERYRSFHKND